jgi:putative flavoprotein involved in K+ transport
MMMRMTDSSRPIVIIGAGQSGLTAAHALKEAGLRPLVLEAGPRTAGSWPSYYDSLRVFSPARFSQLAGHRPFEGDPDRYPSRDEVAAYLEDFAAGLDVEIRTETPAVDVALDGGVYTVRTATGDAIEATGIVAASGSFTNPFRPVFPGQDAFTGHLLHAAEYRNPEPFTGRRVIVVGSGNSAVQIACELARHATVTIASRHPLHLVEQRPGGKDVHYALTAGFDHLPAEWFARFVPGRLASDVDGYRDAFAQGLLDRREMFTGFGGDEIVWSDGTREHVDAVVFATGYRPSLPYLASLGALDGHGMPRHLGGISTSHPGLVYLGLEFQRAFASNTLRGVGRDAAHVIPPLAAYASGALAAIG